MPIDDELYRSELDSAYDDLIEVVDEASSPFFPADLGADDRPGGGMFDGFYHTMDSVRNYFEFYYYLGRLSTGTQDLIEKLEEVDNQLNNLVWSEVDGPTNVAKNKLSDWKGDTAGAFKNGYLTGLAKSIHILYESMASLRESGKIYEAIIDKTRERYMDMLDQTIQAIEESNRLRERESSNGLVIRAIATGALSVIALPTGAGTAALVATTLLAAAQSAGTIIEAEKDADHYSVTGNSFSEILVDFVNKCSTLETDLQKELEKVEESLEEIISQFTGNVEEVLPPYVGLPKDATGDDQDEHGAPPAEWDDTVEDGFVQDEIDEFEEGERV